MWKTYGSQNCRESCGSMWKPFAVVVAVRLGEQSVKNASTGSKCCSAMNSPTSLRVTPYAPRSGSGSMPLVVAFSGSGSGSVALVMACNGSGSSNHSMALAVAVVVWPWWRHACLWPWQWQ